MLEPKTLRQIVDRIEEIVNNTGELYKSSRLPDRFRAAFNNFDIKFTNSNPSPLEADARKLLTDFIEKSRDEAYKKGEFAEAETKKALLVELEGMLRDVPRAAAELVSKTEQTIKRVKKEIENAGY